MESREQSKEYAQRLQSVSSFEELDNWLQFHPLGGIEASIGFQPSAYWIETIQLLRRGEAKITDVTSTHGLRDKVKELLKQEREGSNSILNGEGAEDLYDSSRIYETGLRDRVIAGTDKGVGYDHNEDRVVVSSRDNFVAVIDGIGGHKNGQLAAQILAESFASTSEVNQAVNQASDRMRNKKIEDGGAVFISARVKQDSRGRKFLEIAQVGDAKLFVLDNQGGVGFQTVDQSLVQSMVDEGKINPDEALYHPERNVVTAFVGPEFSPKELLHDRAYVNSGDRVFLMSDGISDNLTPEEISRLTHGKTIEEAARIISKVISERMKNTKQIIDSSDRKKQGKYSDGYKSKPKRDNRALAILEIS